MIISANICKYRRLTIFVVEHNLPFHIADHPKDYHITFNFTLSKWHFFIMRSTARRWPFVMQCIMLEVEEYVMVRRRGKIWQKVPHTNSPRERILSEMQRTIHWQINHKLICYIGNMILVIKSPYFARTNFIVVAIVQWNPIPIITMRSNEFYCNKRTCCSLLYMCIQPIHDSCIPFLTGYTYVSGVKRTKIRWSEILLTPTNLT